MSRLIEDLHPNAQQLFRTFESEMHKAGVDFLVTCTFRTNDEQAALYKQGRDLPGSIVTNARAGESAHNVMVDGKRAACAFDIVILCNGKCTWDAHGAEWQTAGKIGLITGLDWAGVWPRFKEYPHFQLSYWKEIRDGKRP